MIPKERIEKMTLEEIEYLKSLIPIITRNNARNEIIDGYISFKNINIWTSAFVLFVYAVVIFYIYFNNISISFKSFTPLIGFGIFLIYLIIDSVHQKKRLIKSKTDYSYLLETIPLNK